MSFPVIPRPNRPRKVRGSKMKDIIAYTLLGYLAGSILFARVAARFFHKDEMFRESTDGNPGTTNAFLYGGFACGMVTLSGDLLKGFLPVFLFTQARTADELSHAFALVLAAPVFGHAFPLFFKFRGGKGIAVSFGCLLGLFPVFGPVLVLAAYFILFSVILKITPHFHRTLVTYLCSAATLYVTLGINGITLGFFLVSAIVFLRLHISKEKRERMRIALKWTH